MHTNYSMYVCMDEYIYSSPALKTNWFSIILEPQKKVSTNKLFDFFCQIMIIKKLVHQLKLNSFGLLQIKPNIRFGSEQKIPYYTGT